MGEVAQKYPPGAIVTGTVRNSPITARSWNWKRAWTDCCTSAICRGPEDFSCERIAQERGRDHLQVISVDQERKRFALGLKQLQEDPWDAYPRDLSPRCIGEGESHEDHQFRRLYRTGTEARRVVARLELADHKVENPEQFVKVGEELEVRILRIDPAERKIGLSRKTACGNRRGASCGSGRRAEGRTELKGGMEGASGPLFTLGSSEETAETN